MKAKHALILLALGFIFDLSGAWMKNGTLAECGYCFPNGIGAQDRCSDNTDI